MQTTRTLSVLSKLYDKRERELFEVDKLFIDPPMR